MLQILTTEKRTFTGTLMCVDHFGNLLLYDAVEEMNAGKRVLNQIIISLDKVQAASVLVCPQCPGRICQSVVVSFRFTSCVTSCKTCLQWHWANTPTMATKLTQCRIQRKQPYPELARGHRALHMCVRLCVKT